MLCVHTSPTISPTISARRHILTCPAESECNEHKRNSKLSVRFTLPSRYRLPHRMPNFLVSKTLFSLKKITF